MPKTKNQKSRKKVNIIILIIAVIGLLFSSYFIYLNVSAEMERKSSLSRWEEVREEGDKDSGDAAASQKEAGVETTEGNGSDESYRINGGLDYSALTSGDFFPAKLIIPRIGLELISWEGADPQSLEQGPGHIPETPLPGDIGRCTISGHRTTYGSPFNRVDELEEGDLIYLETIKEGLFVYALTGMDIVSPEDVYILEGSDKRELLLTTCHPKYSGAKRLIIISELVNLYPMGIDFYGGGE
jgi:LPXTG-site transpeptidase (sortase) family protein